MKTEFLRFKLESFYLFVQKFTEKSLNFSLLKRPISFVTDVSEKLRVSIEQDASFHRRMVLEVFRDVF